MNLLLDECVTKHFKPQLTDFGVFTVPEMEWSGIKNDKLAVKRRTLDLKQFRPVGGQDRVSCRHRPRSRNSLFLALDVISIASG